MGTKPKTDGVTPQGPRGGTDAASDRRNTDKMHKPRSFQPPRAVRDVARSLLGLLSASGRSFCRQRGRSRVASSSAAPGRRLRECALSLVAVVALRYAFAPFGATVRARPCRVCRERSNAPGRGSQCIRPLLARAARPHPAHCQCCARCALSQEAPPRDAMVRRQGIVLWPFLPEDRQGARGGAAGACGRRRSVPCHATDRSLCLCGHRSRRPDGPCLASPSRAASRAPPARPRPHRRGGASWLLQWAEGK